MARRWRSQYRLLGVLVVESQESGEERSQSARGAPVRSTAMAKYVLKDYVGLLALGMRPNEVLLCVVGNV